MSNKAPANWEEKTLEELCNLQNGYALSSKDYVDKSNTINIRMSNIRPDGSFDENHNIKYLPDDYAEKYSDFILQDGDLIIAMTDMAGDPKILGVPTIVKHHSEACLLMNQRVGKLYDISNMINVDFLKYFLISPEVRKIYKSKGKGGLQLNISKKDILSLIIAVPPLSEQERIVQILDEVFENIEKAKQNTLQNLNNAKELFESFANMILFKNNDFYTTTIGDSCNLATGGTPDTKNQEYYQNGNIKWLVSGDIHQAEIFDCQGRITEKGLNNSNAKYLPINSVLIALNGQGKTRGTVAILRTKATCNQSLVSINPKNSKFLSTEYLYQNLRARYIEIRKMTGDSGNDRRGLNMGLIRSIQINVPKTLNEQLIIAKKLSNLQLLLKQLEQTYNQKLKSLEELKQSILQKAFNGEL